MPTRMSLTVVLMLCLRLSCSAQDSEKHFVNLCAGCHGEAAKGTDRGPALVDNRKLRNRSEDQISEIIRGGTPGGMPPFSLAEPELRLLARWIRSMNVSAYSIQPAGDTVGGEQFFFGKGRCGSCHMIAGRGKANGPDLSDIGRRLANSALTVAYGQDISARSPTFGTMHIEAGKARIRFKIGRAHV